MTNTVTTDQPKTFKQLIETPQYKNEIAKVLPKGVTTDRIVKIVISAMNKNPDLLTCTPISMYQACIDCASLNLWPGVQGHIYLLKRNNKVKENGQERWEHQAEAMIGFRGMIELAYRSGRIVPGSFVAHPIYEHDLFEYEYGSKPFVTHRPKLGDRGKIIGAWAGAKPVDQDFVFHVMDIADIEAIKARSKSKDRAGNVVGPWVTDYAEMCCKTVVRRFWKYLPSNVIDQYQEALEKDMAREFDLKEVTAHVRPERQESRFSDDAPPIEEQVKGAPGKAALDEATAEVERREQQAEPVTQSACIELIKILDDNFIDELYDSYQVNSLSELSPDQLNSFHFSLTKGLKDGKLKQ